MSDFDEPAFPIVHSDEEGFNVISDGLTIRQQAVLMAMQGLVISPGWNGRIDLTAKDAVILADAVLRAEKESRE